MREQPKADELLRYAREVLRQELIPALPKEHRLTGFMIANAMGIATRQLQHGDEHDYQELVALQKLLHNLGHSPDNTLDSSSKTDLASKELLSGRILSHTTLQQELTILNGQLAQLIRKRELKNQQALVFSHLEHIAAIRAIESGG